MKKNVLITGGAGFIGSSLVAALNKDLYTITVLDNLSAQIHGENADTSYLFKSITGKVNFIKGIQSGKVQNYAIYFFGGIIALAVVFIYLWK